MNESIRKIIDTKFKKSLLVGTLALSLVGSSLLSQNVDAKKNSKPKIVMKGKLKKKKLTLTKGQALKLKFKAKDKEDGNLTKKVKVKVQKPKSGKIKKSKRKIKFLKIGKYKLTFTVKDSKNKKTKVKRIVKVVPKTLNNDNNSDNNLILNTSSPSDLPENTIPYVSTKPDVSKSTPTEVPINTNTPISTSISTSEPTLAPESSVNPITTQTPILPTINPINTTIPTSTPVQTQMPDNYDPLYSELRSKYAGEMKYGCYVTKEKIVEEKFLDNSDGNMELIFKNDYGNIVIDQASDYFETDAYLQFLGTIVARDYKRRILPDNVIISTYYKYNEEGNLDDQVDKMYPIYVYAEDTQGNAITKKFFVTQKYYTEEERVKYMGAREGQFRNLIQKYPAVFAYKRNKVPELNEENDIKEKVLK